MRHYRNRAFPKKIIPLNGSYLELQEEWILLKGDKKRDVSKFLQLCEPWLEEWEVELSEQKNHPRHQTQFLLMNLEIVSDPQDMITNWIEAIKNSGSTLRMELEILLIELLRSKYWIAKIGFITPRCCAQIITVLFRHRIRNSIQKVWKAVDYIPVVDIEEYTRPWHDNEVDIILIESLGLTAWNSYILEMYKRGYNRDDMMIYTHYPQHIIRQEQTELWNQLNTI